MIRVISLFIILFSFPNLTNAESFVESTPVLVVDNHPICSDIIDSLDASHQRKSTYGEGGEFLPFNRDIAGTLKHLKNTHKLTLLGQAAYFGKYKHCENCGHSLYLSSNVFSRDDAKFRKQIIDSPHLKAIAGGELFKTNSGDYYAIGGGIYDLRVYQVTPQVKFIESCHIILSSADSSITPRLSSALDAALENMKRAQKHVLGNQGACGVNNLSLDIGRQFNSALDELSHEPINGLNAKQLDKIGVKLKNELVKLKDWSLSDIYSFERFKQFEKSYAESLSVLTVHYQQKFSWPLEKAERLAKQSLDSVLSDAFSFSDYKPFSFKHERELRDRILSGKSIEDLAFDYQEYGKYFRDSMNHHAIELNLLALAVNNTKAMAHLLEKGVNVNAVNKFGKTALMYAAQHNNLEAIRLLIEAGAFINSETYIPFMKCRFGITTSGYTALHYAVRYASYDVIEYLVKAGAAIFAKTNNEHRAGNDRFPVDWLDSNSKLSKNELKKLKRLLNVPNRKGMSKLAHEQIVNAQKSLEQLNFDKAYMHISNATSLVPTNTEAMLMMAKIANLVHQPRKAINVISSIYQLELKSNERAKGVMHVIDAININVLQLNDREWFWSGKHFMKTEYKLQFLLLANKLAPDIEKRLEIEGFLHSKSNRNCSSDSSVRFYIEDYSRYEKSLTGKVNSAVHLISKEKILKVCATTRYSPNPLEKCFSNPDFVTLNNQKILSSFYFPDFYLDPDNSTYSIKLDGVAECL